MTLIFSLSGSRGASVFDSFIEAPWPSALQWSSLMPQPRNTMPKRVGNADGGGTSAKACSDSSQGNATVQPAPRSTARREMGNANVLVSRDILVHLSRGYLRWSRGRQDSFVSELRAHDNGFHHRIETVVVRGQVGQHAIDQ